MINQIPEKLYRQLGGGDDIITHELNKGDIEWRLPSLISTLYYDISLDKDIEVRSPFLNEHYPLHETKHVDIYDDIFYFKLLKLGLVDIRFFFFEYEEGGQKGRELYEFMSDFQIPLDENHKRGIMLSSGFGRVQYDIDEIVKNHFHKFVSLLYEVIDEENEEITEDNYDDAFVDRVAMEVIIPDGQEFIFQTARKLAMTKKNYTSVLKMLIKKYNENGTDRDEIQKISIPSSNLLGNPHYVSILTYLAEKGKIRLKGIFRSERKKGTYDILYIPDVYRLTDIHFNRYEEFIFGKDEKQIIVAQLQPSSLNNGILQAGDFKDTLIAGRPKEFIHLFYHLKKDGEYSVSYSDMTDFLDKNSFKGYEKLKGLVFKKGIINELLRKKNDSYGNKDELKLILIGDFFRPGEDSIGVAF